MLTNEQKLDIMKQAFQEGYDGFMTDLFAQADPQESIEAPQNTPAPSTPNLENVQTHSSTAPANFIPAKEIPNSQSLVQSYESANIGEMPMGANVPMQLEEPNSYDKGGFRISEMIGYKPDLTDISPRNYMKDYKTKYEKGGEGNHLEKVEYIYKKRKMLEDGGRRPMPDIVPTASVIPNKEYDPLGFSEYYYKSPKHRERLENRGYSEEDIQERSEFLDGYGFSKGPKIIDRDRNQGSRAYPRKNKIVMDPVYDKKQDPNITYDEVLSHEISHLSTGYKPLKKKDVKEIVDRQDLYDIPKEKQDRYASEIKADLDAIRFMLFNAGVYDAGTEDFDWYDLNNAKEKLKDSPTFKRIIDSYKDNDFIWLMNNIAMENMETGDGVALMKEAKLGGKRKKYAHGGSHEGEGNPPVEQMSDDQLKAYIYLMGHNEVYDDPSTPQVFEGEMNRMRKYLDSKYGEGNWEYTQSPFQYRADPSTRGDFGKTMSHFTETFPENFGPDTDLILMGHNYGQQFMHTPWSDIGNYGAEYNEQNFGPEAFNLPDNYVHDPNYVDTWAEGLNAVLPENYAGTCYMGTCSPSRPDVGNESNIESMLSQMAQGRTDLGGMNVFGANEMWYGPKPLSKHYPVSDMPGGGLSDIGFADMLYDPKNVTGNIVQPYDQYSIDYGDPVQGDGLTYWWRDESGLPTNTPFDIDVSRRDLKSSNQFTNLDDLYRRGGRRYENGGPFKNVLSGIWGEVKKGPTATRNLITDAFMTGATEIGDYISTHMNPVFTKNDFTNNDEGFAYERENLDKSYTGSHLDIAEPWVGNLQESLNTFDPSKPHVTVKII